MFVSLWSQRYPVHFGGPQTPNLGVISLLSRSQTFIDDPLLLNIDKHPSLFKDKAYHYHYWILASLNTRAPAHLSCCAWISQKREFSSRSRRPYHDGVHPWFASIGLINMSNPSKGIEKLTLTSISYVCLNGWAFLIPASMIIHLAKTSRQQHQSSPIIHQQATATAPHINYPNQHP